MAYTENKVSGTVIGRDGDVLASSSRGGVGSKEIEPAIVLSSYEDSGGKITIYTLLSKTVLEAQPLDENIKTIPLRGELVLYRSYKLKKIDSNNPLINFYEILPWKSSVHMNALALVNLILEKEDTLKNFGIDINKIPGIKQTFDRGDTKIPNKYFSFSTRFNKKLIPFEGDYIIQGRSGQSIRFGSAIPKLIKVNGIDTTSYFEEWNAASSTEGGNPFIIISSGKSKFNDLFFLEDIQNDPSTILLSNGGDGGLNLPFLLSAVQSAPKKFKVPSSYNENLILLNSDFIVINSKKSHIVLSSDRDIACISNNNIYLKADNNVEIAAKKINLGEDALISGEPVVLSDKLAMFLTKLMDIISRLSYDNYGQVLKISPAYIELIALKDSIKKIKDVSFGSKNTFSL